MSMDSAIPYPLNYIDAYDAVIIGLIPIYFRSASMLFDLVSTFIYEFAYFSIGFDTLSEPIVVPIYISTLLEDSLAVD